MKNLILIRHSDAEFGSFNTTDFERKLTPQGKNKTNLQANRLKKKNLIPDLIITSSAIRANETSRIFLDVLNPKCQIQQVPFLYEDFTTNSFFELIAQIDPSKGIVIIVGHNPTISVMASRLDIDTLISFKPCSIGIFEVSKSWNLLGVGDGRMSEFIMG